MAEQTTEEPYRTTFGDAWALIGSWMIITFIALSTGGFVVLFAGLHDFFTGDAPHLLATKYPPAKLLPTVLAAVSFITPVMFVTAALAQAVYGVATSNVMQRRAMQLPKVYAASAVVVKHTVFEDMRDELIARGALLGILLPILSGIIGQHVAFYGLCFIGTSITALLYLGNFRDAREQRQIGRVLPHFLAGIVTAVVFTKFAWLGLVASILVHVLTVLLQSSLDRFTVRQRRGAWRVLLGAGLLCAVTYVQLGLLPYQIVHLQFRSFHEYLFGVLFLSGLLLLMLELLLYDADTQAAPVINRAQNRVDEYKPSGGRLISDDLKNAVPATIFIMLPGVVLIFTQHLLAIALVAGLAVVMYVFGGGAVSVNGMARLVWENGPILLLELTAIPVIGFWPVAAIVFAREVICRLIRRSLRYA